MGPILIVAFIAILLIYVARNNITLDLFTQQCILDHVIFFFLVRGVENTTCKYSAILEGAYIKHYILLGDLSQH